MTEYSDFLKHLCIDKKQMLASMMSKIPESEKPSKRGREMTKEYTPEEIKNRLSNIGEAIGNIALDYITELEKENAELKQQVSFLEDNLRVARKDRENLQLDVAKGLKEFVKDYPATSLRYLANEKYVEQLTKAKDLIENIIRVTWGEGWNYSLDWKVKAEQFFKDSEVEK